MNHKCKSAKVSEVEEHVSLKYDIKKRIGKGVSPALRKVAITWVEFATLTSPNSASAPYLNFTNTDSSF